MHTSHRLLSDPSSPPPGFSSADELHMRRALWLAEQAVGLSDPNPRVGCVLVAPDGRVIGEGHTQPVGGPHAEVVALNAARAAGADLAGATAYVTLEPCAHHGRTPPCCDALIHYGIRRVVTSIIDPNPLVGGQGLARLRAAGVQVDNGLCADEARELNIGFLSRMLRGQPWVRLKVATSLDGRTALPDGRSQWITGPAARADGHAYRRRASAVLSGIGTVLADDPRLDVRLVPTTLQPLRVVVDADLATPPGARCLQPPGRALIVSRQPAAAGSPLAQEGVEILALPAADAAERGHVDLAALLAELAQRGVNELHVEAGAGLNGALLRAGLVDELLVYIAPMLLGDGLPLAQLAPLASLDEAARFAWHSAHPVGPDLRLLARPINRLTGWLAA